MNFFYLIKRKSVMNHKKDALVGGEGKGRKVIVCTMSEMEYVKLKKFHESIRPTVINENEKTGEKIVSCDKLLYSQYK